MNRRFHLLSCVALLSACVLRPEKSTDPNAGEYDGYYGEAGGGGGASGAEGGESPRPRTALGSRGAEPRRGKKLVAKKPPRDPDAPTRPTRQPQATLELAGFVPTAAGPGSLVSIYGGGFAAKPSGNKVTVAGKAWEVVAGTSDRIDAKVPTGAKSGPLQVKVGKQTATSDAKVNVMAESFGAPATRTDRGLLGNVYDIGKPVTELPSFDQLGNQLAVVAVDALDVKDDDFSGIAVDGRTLREWFAIHFRGSLNVTQGGEYNLCLASDDGSQLYIDETLLVNNDGVHQLAEKCELVYMEPGEYQVDILYFQANGPIALRWTWAKDGGEKQVVPADVLFRPVETMVR